MRVSGSECRAGPHSICTRTVESIEEYPMDVSAWGALLAAIIAGSVALFGYSLAQISNQRDRKRKFYAEALSAVREYEELPYRIRRRLSSDDITRAALGERISDAYTKLRFYLAWLEIDSVVVGTAYADLVNRTRRIGGHARKKAWQKPIITRDEEMAFPEEYHFDNKEEWKLCVSAMRRELSLWSFASHGGTLRALAAQRDIRSKEAQDDEPMDDYTLG